MYILVQYSIALLPTTGFIPTKILAIIFIILAKIFKIMAKIYSEGFFISG